MHEILVALTEIVVPFINLVALGAILFGTIECLVGVVRTMVLRDRGHALRVAWLRYARWLVAALTFQLGADILETAIAPTWDEIGQLAAIAVIRTFLEYFIGRDVTELREREERTAEREDAAR